MKDLGWISWLSTAFIHRAERFATKPLHATVTKVLHLHCLSHHMLQGTFWTSLCTTSHVTDTKGKESKEFVSKLMWHYFQNPQFPGLKNAAGPDTFNLPNKVSPTSLPVHLKADSMASPEGPSKNFRDSSWDLSCCLFQPKDKNEKRKKKRKVQFVDFPRRRYHLSQHIHSIETSSLFSV